MLLKLTERVKLGYAQRQFWAPNRHCESPEINLGILGDAPRRLGAQNRRGAPSFTPPAHVHFHFYASLLFAPSSCTVSVTFFLIFDLHFVLIQLHFTLSPS